MTVKTKAQGISSPILSYRKSSKSIVKASSSHQLHSRQATTAVDFDEHDLIDPTKKLESPSSPASICTTSSHKNSEDLLFNSLDSVHTASSSISNLSFLHDSKTSFEDDEDSDDEGSFASLGPDEDDEEAYREAQKAMDSLALDNPLIRREGPFTPLSPRWTNRKPSSMKGTLELIAE